MNQTIELSSKSFQELQDWDADALSQMVGNDPAVLRRFLEMFLTRSDQQIKVIVQALQTNDARLIADTAHALKSSARAVGALRLGELCQALEAAGKSNDLQSSQAISTQMAQSLEVVCQLITQHLHPS